MATFADHTIQRFIYNDVTFDQWRDLKSKLAKNFSFPITSDIGKIEYGETTYRWQRGVFEWEYRYVKDGRTESGTLEFGIRRRPFDTEPTNIEIAINSFFSEEAVGKKLAAAK